MIAEEFCFFSLHFSRKAFQLLLQFSETKTWLKLVLYHLCNSVCMFVHTPNAAELYIKRLCSSNKWRARIESDFIWAIYPFRLRQPSWYTPVDRMVQTLSFVLPHFLLCISLSEDVHKPTSPVPPSGYVWFVWRYLVTGDLPAFWQLTLSSHPC